MRRVNERKINWVNLISMYVHVYMPRASRLFLFFCSTLIIKGVSIFPSLHCTSN